MNQAELLKSVEAPVNEKIPQLTPGDVVSVHLKIKEGDRERIQVFKGTVLLVRGSANDASFKVRRVASNGIGVERTLDARPALTRSKLIAAPRFAEHGCISCGNAPAKRRSNSAFNPFDLQGFIARFL